MQAPLVRPLGVPLWKVVAFRDPYTGRVRVGHWEPLIPAYNAHNVTSARSPQP